MLKLDSLKEWMTDFKQTTLFKEWKYWLSLCVTVASGLYLLCSLGLLGSPLQELVGFPGKELVEALHHTNPNEHAGGQKNNSSNDEKSSATPGALKSGQPQEMPPSAALTGKEEGTQSTEPDNQNTHHLPEIPPKTWFWGLIQIAALPLGAGVVQWTSPKGFKRIFSNILSFAMLFVYIVSFGLTYNAAVLLLAVVAWMLAAAHLGEIRELNTVAGEAVEGLSSFARGRIDSFYDEFYHAIKEVGKRGEAVVLSVEQRWTMNYAAWPEYVQGDELETEKMGSLVEGIRKTDFCRAIVESSAKSFLFIGPMPQRVGQSYEPDSFSQLIALVYSMCVLEIARRIRLKGANAAEDMSMRAQCAIAEVPIWVKIVGDRYWVLQGDAHIHFVIQRGTARAKVEDEGRQGLIHAENIQSYGRVIESHARNARRAYEYVSALLIQAAIELEIGEDVAIHNRLPAIIHEIYGAKPVGIGSYLKYLQIKENRLASVNDIAHLFALFLGLHLSQEITLDKEHLANCYNSATIARLWERSA